MPATHLHQRVEARREFYFDTLFPKVVKVTKSVGLIFDEKLIWRITDELFEDVVKGKKALIDM